jgi:hypothetical protein
MWPTAPRTKRTLRAWDWLPQVLRSTMSPSPPRYEEIAARLDAAGVEAVTNDVPDAAMRQLFLSDPNGVRIELNVT